MQGQSYSFLPRRRWLWSLPLAIVLSQLPLLAQIDDDVFTIVHTFNPGSAIETRWLVSCKAVQCEGACTPGTQPLTGLHIVRAFFKPGPTAPYIQILGETGISEIFVPYHQTPGERLYDNQFASLVKPTQSELGPGGGMLGDYIVTEIRDRGLAWRQTREEVAEKDPLQVVNRGMRGQELVLWAILNNGNYDYLTEFDFRDDGSIACRAGATGFLNRRHPLEGHVHDFLWRVDVDLNGGQSDAVLVFRHREPIGSLQASDRFVLFNGGFEGFADWSDREFTELTIIARFTRNATGKQIAYDLKPLRRGTARHVEEFSQHDFWVTRFHPGEVYYPNVPSYVMDRETIQSTNVVIWYNSSMHHLPRDEDNGAMPIVWTGFELTPRNLVERNPLFQP